MGGNRQSSTEATPTAASASDHTVRDLLRSLTLSQAWAIGAAVVALLGGTFGLGAFIQSSRDDGKVNELTAKQATANLEKDHTIADLETKNSDLKRTIDTLKGALESALNQKESLDGKAEFLNRYLSYVQGPNGVSKKLLVDVVCLMWKETQKRRIQIDRQPVEISVDKINRGLDQDTQRLLSKSGVSPETIERIRQPEAFVVGRFAVSPSVVKVDPTQVLRVRDEAVTTLQRQIQDVKVIKIITFFDGSRYQMPDEIAVAVHTKPECAPI